jgi:DNA-binding GntR family transcriptional regulator
MNHAVSRSVLADQVREHLLAGIVSGRYPPHSRIVETQVARELGTSQAPVREALRDLQAIGVVEISPFRGARVRRPSRREILEAYAVRVALETLAARLAIPRLTDAQVDELARYGGVMDAAAAAGDGHTVSEADARLHGRIVELSGNRALERTWLSLQPNSRTYLSFIVPGADPAWSAHLHTPILEAIRRRDVEGAVRALEAHFAEAADNMADRWPDDGADEGSPEGDAPEGRRDVVSRRTPAAVR